MRQVESAGGQVSGCQQTRQAESAGEEGGQSGRSQQVRQVESAGEDGRWSGRSQQATQAGGVGGANRRGRGRERGRTLHDPPFISPVV